MAYSGYAERAYFTAEACAHCAAHDDHLRLERKRNQVRAALSRGRR